MRNGKTTAHRTKADLTQRKLRSAISNGSSLLAGCDHRSAQMRRLKDLFNDHVADLGGVENLSTAELALVRRSSMLILQLEIMEGRWQENKGEASAKQIECYQRVANTLRRLLESLGLQRRQKDITPATGISPDLKDMIRRAKAKAAGVLPMRDHLEPWDTPKAYKRYLKTVHAQRRKLSKQNPALSRKLRKMTDEELDHLETELLEREIQRRRLLPNFNRDPALQLLVAKYEYSIRANYEGATWRAYNRNKPRKSLPRYRGRAAQAANQAASQAALPTNLTELVGNATGPQSPLEAPSVPNASPAALTPASERPSPLPDNVVPLRPDRFYSKFFHTGNTNSVW